MKKLFLLVIIICSGCFISFENESEGLAQCNIDFGDEERIKDLNLIASITSREAVSFVGFNYSFTTSTYDENMEFKSAQAVFNNVRFISILTSLNPEHTINLGSPIAEIFEIRELLNIHDNPALNEPLKRYTKHEIWIPYNKTRTELLELIPLTIEAISCLG